MNDQHELEVQNHVFSPICKDLDELSYSCGAFLLLALCFIRVLGCVLKSIRSLHVGEDIFTVMSLCESRVLIVSR